MASDQHIGALQLVGSGSLDVSNYAMFINYGSTSDPITAVAGYIKSGYNGGAWHGAGIFSSAAATNNQSYGLGYADSADPGNPAGLPSGQVEIKYTLLGDANLDGKVNGTDFSLMAANFNKAVTNGWDQGDFNYDGAVNGTDFVLLADNFNQFASQSAVATSTPATRTAASNIATQPITTVSTSDSNDVVGTVLGKPVAKKKPHH